MVLWHNDLPQCPLRNGYSVIPRSNVVSTTMDTGFPKSRKKFTKVGSDYKISLSMTTAQLEIWTSFFHDTLNSGATSFMWVEPITKEPMLCNITKIITMGVPAGNKYIVSFNMTGWV